MAPFPDRFWARVDRRGPDDCWEWLAVLDRHGYGQVYFEGKIHRAHRVAMRLSGITLVAGLDVDHLCRNRACVNPAHLEQVAHQINCRRGATGGHERAKTHCRQGHPYDAENTYMRRTPGRSPDRLERQCRACSRIYSRAKNLRRRHPELVPALA